MVTTLSELVETTQGTAVPQWLRNEVLKNKDQIAEALRKTGCYTLNGPDGQQVIIHAERSLAAAR